MSLQTDQQYSAYNKHSASPLQPTQSFIQKDIGQDDSGNGADTANDGPIAGSDNTDSLRDHK